MCLDCKTIWWKFSPSGSITNISNCHYCQRVSTEKPFSSSWPFFKNKKKQILYFFKNSSIDGKSPTAHFFRVKFHLKPISITIFSKIICFEFLVINLRKREKSGFSKCPPLKNRIVVKNGFQWHFWCNTSVLRPFFVKFIQIFGKFLRNFSMQSGFKGNWTI